MPTSTFDDLGLPAPLVAALRQRRINEPFPIQTQTIPDVLAGEDLLGRAPTGSGKTLAFGLPMLAMTERAKPKRPTGLILSPTRELAEQIQSELHPLAQAVNLRVLAVYGGVSVERHRKALTRGVDLLVACPGRLLDLVGQRAVNLGSVVMVAVDEADRMADMGFLPDVSRIVEQTNRDRQTILFSATLDDDVAGLSAKFQTQPVSHSVGSDEPDVTAMTHRFIELEFTQRIELCAQLIDDTGPTMVFTRTRHGADRLARQLKKEGVSTVALHGGRTQSQRKKALQRFVDCEAQALIATDVAARGIHVDDVAGVIHYDLPEDAKAYIHRSGRTARAGASGTVFAFVTNAQRKSARRLQNDVGLDVRFEPIPDLPAIDPDRKVDLIVDPGRKRGSGKKRGDGRPSARSGPKRKTRPPRKSKGKNNRSRYGVRTGGESDGDTDERVGRGAKARRSRPRNGRSSNEGDDSRPPRSKRNPKAKRRRADRGDTDQSHTDGFSGSGSEKGRPGDGRKSRRPKSKRQKASSGSDNGSPKGADQRSKPKRSGKPRPKTKSSSQRQSFNGPKKNKMSSGPRRHSRGN